MRRRGLKRPRFLAGPYSWYAAGLLACSVARLLPISTKAVQRPVWAKPASQAEGADEPLVQRQ
eukprot:967642-Lingulodinium_polyedra.AAC.1